MSNDPPSAQRAVRLYSRLAYATVAAIVLGYITLVPTISAALASLAEHAWGRGLLAACLVAVAAMVLGLWVAALWYAGTSREVIARGTLLVVLVVTHVVGAVFYYWCVVHWRDERRRARLVVS